MKNLIKFKKFFNKNKKYFLIGETVILAIELGIAYVIYNKGKFSFDEWLKTAPTEQLEDVYEKIRLEVFCKTGEKPSEMVKISRELGERGAKEWFKKHPPNLDPNFRWTDANRWE